MLQLDQELNKQQVPLVGPILSKNFTAQAIISALMELNPDLHLSLEGSYIKVLCPERCVLSRYAVEKYIGRNFDFPRDLEINMPSFKGKFYLLKDEAFWIG